MAEVCARCRLPVVEPIPEFLQAKQSGYGLHATVVGVHEVCWLFQSPEGNERIDYLRALAASGGL